MSLTFPLSAMQRQVWALLNKGFSHNEVAQQLHTSRQYVHQTRRNAERNLTKALMDVAEAANLQVRKLEVNAGILWGYHPSIDCNVVVTFTVKDGIRLWHWIEEPESISDDYYWQETRTYLLNLAAEHNIQLLEDQLKLHPVKLANYLFQELLPGVSP